MSTWNYRLVKHSEDKEVWYAIHEAYYDKEGHLKSITENPIRIISDCVLDMDWLIREIRKALDRSVLNYEEFCK